MEFKWDEGPSRNLDARVHLKNGNSELDTYSVDSYYSLESCGYEIELDYSDVQSDVPHYSTDINAAMVIADKFGFSVNQTERGWFAGIMSGPIEALISGSIREGWVIALTPEMAICGAFLNTKNLRESEGIRLVSSLIR